MKNIKLNLFLASTLLTSVIFISLPIFLILKQFSQYWELINLNYTSTYILGDISFVAILSSILSLISLYNFFSVKLFRSILIFQLFLSAFYYVILTAFVLFSDLIGTGNYGFYPPAVIWLIVFLPIINNMLYKKWKVHMATT